MFFDRSKIPWFLIIALGLAWLVFDQLNMIYSYFDRLKLIFDRSKNLKGNFKELSALLNRYPIGTRSIEECFKRKIKSFSEHVFFNFSFFLSLFLFSLSIDPAKIFLSFLSQIFKGFSSSSLGKTLLPFLFLLFSFLIVFFSKNLNKRFLGFLMF